MFWHIHSYMAYTLTRVVQCSKTFSTLNCTTTGEYLQKMGFYPVKRLQCKHLYKSRTKMRTQEREREREREREGERERAFIREFTVLNIKYKTSAV